MFLPITVILYYLFGGTTKNVNVKNIILLIASLVFYAWGEPVYIILMLISIVFNYVIGRDIDRAREDGDGKTAKRKFVLSIIFNLAVIGFFKYFGFIVENINTLFNANIRVPELALPVGISFYTFQIMSYIIDLYRGKVKVQKNAFAFALYISLFPQLIAGPIVRYADIEYQLQHRKETFNKFSEGVTRFTVGLGKKLILANTLGAVYTGVQELEIGQTSLVTAWIGIICYTLQIYFDFSGYSDMAIGLGRMFGFEFVENFNYPYIADSVTDFWRRWHISLSTWFREYVYIPLGGNRCKTPRVIFNLMVVWFLTGLWHGAAWNFIVWGMYYGILLILEKYVFGKVIEKMPSALRHIITMVIVMLGWVFFSAPTLTDAVHYLGAMVGTGGGLIDSQAIYLLSSNWLPIIIGVFCATPIYKKIAERFSDKFVNELRVIALPLLFALCIIFMISETYNPFLYFRF